jgi:hypothetical protein
VGVGEGSKRENPLHQSQTFTGAPNVFAVEGNPSNAEQYDYFVLSTPEKSNDWTKFAFVCTS